METFKALHIKVTHEGITYEGFIQEVKEAAEATPDVEDKNQMTWDKSKWNDGSVLA